jgi:hypothetical protein
VGSLTNITSKNAVLNVFYLWVFLACTYINAYKMKKSSGIAYGTYEKAKRGHCPESFVLWIELQLERLELEIPGSTIRAFLHPKNKKRLYRILK